MMNVRLPRVLLQTVVGRDVLAGRKAGEVDRPLIEKAVRAVAVDGQAIVDLKGVEVLSSSYFDAAIWSLSTVTPPLYVALTNVPPAAMDDIEIVMKSWGAALWHFKGKTDTGSFVGKLDDVLMGTLKLLGERGEASAAQLSETDRSLVPTVWNNRLNALHDMRLVRRRKDGRRFLYELAWKEA